MKHLSRKLSLAEASQNDWETLVLFVRAESADHFLIVNHHRNFTVTNGKQLFQQ
jgi:hypothetical protein